jgi:hypothetical protein
MNSDLDSCLKHGDVSDKPDEMFLQHISQIEKIYSGSNVLADYCCCLGKETSHGENKR